MARIGKTQASKDETLIYHVYHSGILDLTSCNKSFKLSCKPSILHLIDDAITEKSV